MSDALRDRFDERAYAEELVAEFNQSLGAQAQRAYEAAINSPCPDWRAVAELLRDALQAEQVKRSAKPKTAATGNLPDYNVDPRT